MYFEYQAESGYLGSTRTAEQPDKNDQRYEMTCVEVSQVSLYLGKQRSGEYKVYILVNCKWDSFFFLLLLFHIMQELQFKNYFFPHTYIKHEEVPGTANKYKEVKERNF